MTIDNNQYYTERSAHNEEKGLRIIELIRSLNNQSFVMDSLADVGTMIGCWPKLIDLDSNTNGDTS